VNDSGARPLSQPVLWGLAEGTRDKENADEGYAAQGYAEERRGQMKIADYLKS